MENNKKMATAGLFVLVFVPLIALGASSGIAKMTLNHAEKAWNYSNSTIVALESEIALEREIEKENFCFLVEVKKDQGLSISQESLSRHGKDCLGLQ